MRCKIVRRRLSAFQDGELDQTTTERIEQHLQHCADCEEALQILRTTYQVLQTPAVTMVPAAFQLELDAKLRARQPSTRAALPRRAWVWVPVGVVTAVFLGITLAGIVGNELLDSAPAAQSAEVQLDDHFTIAPPGSITKTFLEKTNPQRQP